MNCPFCKTKNKDNAVFCKGCGRRISDLAAGDADTLELASEHPELVVGSREMISASDIDKSSFLARGGRRKTAAACIALVLAFLLGTAAGYFLHDAINGGSGQGDPVSDIESEEIE